MEAFCHNKIYRFSLKLFTSHNDYIEGSLFKTKLCYLLIMLYAERNVTRIQTLLIQTAADE